MLINKTLNFLYKTFDYRFYKKKYNVDIKFNGYGIRFVGNGCFVCHENSYISYNSFVNLAENTTLKIGKNVSISNFVRIYTSGFNTEVLIRNGHKEAKDGDVTIGSNVLIGSGCFICPNVTIGDNVVIGANSVVVCDLPSNTVCAGSPAKVIKYYD
ncbi:acyltransferase [Pseudoalteromonas sp. BSi20439]|uniref:acyltransferase n=1 Tax=Pseudoalteromonas sp. BSi20439 TaxID=420915 RepID=UPI000562C701|nr:acyltransferase [Pseudoalteromonas sp. BSi20439]